MISARPGRTDVQLFKNCALRVSNQKKFRTTFSTEESFTKQRYSTHTKRNLNCTKRLKNRVKWYKLSENHSEQSPEKRKLVKDTFWEKQPTFCISANCKSFKKRRMMIRAHSNPFFTTVALTRHYSFRKWLKNANTVNLPKQGLYQYYQSSSVTCSIFSPRYQTLTYTFRSCNQGEKMCLHWYAS